VLIIGPDAARDAKESIDVCVVGSGAGGALAAKELTSARLSPIVLEAGEIRNPTTFSQHAPKMLHRLF